MLKLFSNRKRALLPGLCCSLLLLSACATTMRAEDTIESRTMARWDAVLSGDLDGAYGFLSPGYRSSVSSVQYQKSLLLKQVQWSKATYTGSECTETTCKVKISLDYTVYGALAGVKSFTGVEIIEESWVKSENSWYLVPQR